MYKIFVTTADLKDLHMGKIAIHEGSGRKRKMWKVGLFSLSRQGSNIILRRCCVCDSSLSGSKCAVESFPSTPTQVMCYILQANLNGRFLPNPLPMTSLLPTKRQFLLTQLVTQPKREPNVGTERETGVRERVGASGCRVFSLLKKTVISGVFPLSWKRTL